MADRYKKSGLSFKGVNKAEFNKNRELQDEKLGINKSMEQSLTNQLESLSMMDRLLNKALKTDAQRDAILENSLELQKDMTSEQSKQVRKKAEALEKTIEMSDGIRESLKGMTGLVSSAKAFVTVLLTNPIVAIAAGILAIGKLLYSAFTAARDFRTELGGSLANAGLIALKLKAVEGALFTAGFSTENVKENFDAIRKNLGGVEAASGVFLYNFSKLQQITGATADNLATVLSIQESVSDASRDTLLAQMEANALAIELKGIAPEAVFNDLAENAEFFATSMKAGTSNVMKTAIEARKLGLNLSTVAKISESLLDFESSIEKQMEASVLLGRQLNLDKARQLSFMDDQEGMMREILKQVGGEAEFERLKGFQRRALADAVGVDVAELAKLARQQEGAATGAQVAATVEDKQLSVQEKMLMNLEAMSKITGESLKEQKKTYGALSE